MTLFHLGQPAPALERFDQTMALYDAQKRRSQRALQDPGVGCLSYRAPVLWLLGYPDQALETSREALALARELSHPFSLACALVLAAVVSQQCGKVREAQERADEASALCSERGIPFFFAWGSILRGWALTAQGRGEEGIEQKLQGLAAYSATGAELARPYFLALLAEAYGKAGQTHEGLNVLTEAQAAVKKTGERFWETELHRIKGELLSRLPPAHRDEATACFREALDVARRQSAKSLELRAATSLGRLWQRQGKSEEARYLLTEVYGWFTEGFDTADLKEAKALLEELAT
jgi:predicted ATPase